MADKSMDTTQHEQTYEKVFITGMVKWGTPLFMLMMAMVVYFTT
jgi:hypothetical protein